MRDCSTARSKTILVFSQDGLNSRSDVHEYHLIDYLIQSSMATFRYGHDVDLRPLGRSITAIKCSFTIT